MDNAKRIINAIDLSKALYAEYYKAPSPERWEAANAANNDLIPFAKTRPLTRAELEPGPRRSSGGAASRARPLRCAYHDRKFLAGSGDRMSGQRRCEERRQRGNMSGNEIQSAYEADGGLPGKLAVGRVWRDVAVSCQCETVDATLVDDEPGEDIHFNEAIKRLRQEWQRCPDCEQAYRIGLGRAQ